MKNQNISGIVLPEDGITKTFWLVINGITHPNGTNERGKREIAQVITADAFF